MDRRMAQHLISSNDYVSHGANKDKTMQQNLILYLVVLTLVHLILVKDFFVYNRANR